MTRILMIEDDDRLASMVAAYLRDAGFEVEVAGDAGSGVRALEANAPDIVLLDLMLPDGDGLEVCRRLRATSSVPVIMVTARGDTTDRIVGLELGADDYLAKPFDPRELLARLRAVLRRHGDDHAADVLRFGRLEIDRAARRVSIDGQARELTARQFDLLLAMAERAGRVLSREQLIDAVGGDGSDPLDRTIDVHVVKVRAAIEDDPKHPRRVLTVRGAGYVFAKAQD
ncbi:MAG: response regulator transcription factor [Burkholderiaceae bacterium]|nr:response regulator transcription factor [Burkholderiaceae bacterium]